MIVVDASVLANVLADDGPDGRQAREQLGRGGAVAAPELIDVETVSVLRKRWLAGDLVERRFEAALGDLEELPLSRYPLLPMMRRANELRANVTPYDAAYVALAEGLRCSLLTADARLSRAPELRCQVEVLG